MIGLIRKILRARRWRALMRDADAARDRGDVGVAADLYRAITRRFPERSASWGQLGNMSKDRGDFATAERAYQAVLSIRPEDPDVHLQLGHLAKLRGSLQQAIEFYQKATALHPDSPAVEELKAMGFRPGGDQLSGEDAQRLDLPLRAIIAHQRLISAFAQRRA